MHFHAYALPPWFGLTFTIVVCGGAFWKGGREEQIAAAGMLLSWLATLVLRDPRWLGTQWGAFGADVGFLIVLAAVALRTPRYWPLAAAAFQLLAVTTHTARMLDHSFDGWTYATAEILWTPLVLWAIGFGVWGTWRTRRQPVTSVPATAPGATRR